MRAYTHLHLLVCANACLRLYALTPSCHLLSHLQSQSATKARPERGPHADSQRSDQDTRVQGTQPHRQGAISTGRVTAVGALLLLLLLLLNSLITVNCRWWLIRAAHLYLIHTSRFKRLPHALSLNCHHCSVPCAGCQRVAQSSRTSPLRFQVVKTGCLQILCQPRPLMQRCIVSELFAARQANMRQHNLMSATGLREFSQPQLLMVAGFHTNIRAGSAQLIFNLGAIPLGQEVDLPLAAKALNVLKCVQIRSLRGNHAETYPAYISLSACFQTTHTLPCTHRASLSFMESHWLASSPYLAGKCFAISLTVSTHRNTGFLLPQLSSPDW